jgi:hypothetical protein
LLVAFETLNSATLPTAPAGWSTKKQITWNGGNASLTCYFQQVPVAGPPANYTFNGVSPQEINVVIENWSVSQNAPDGEADATGTSTAPAASITGSVGSFLVLATAWNSGSATLTEPTHFTQDLDEAGVVTHLDVSNDGGFYNGGAATATGTLTGSSPWAEMLVSIPLSGTGSTWAVLSESTLFESFEEEVYQ